MKELFKWMFAYRQVQVEIAISEYAKKLQDHCKTTDCRDCQFHREDVQTHRCHLHTYPYRWKEDVL